jgi:hypothetical protein
LISHKKEVDTDNKFGNDLKITGIINNVLRPQKTLKKTRIKLYIKARDARITAAEMKYMRRTARHTSTDHETNTENAKELDITQILDKIQSYKKN